MTLSKFRRRTIESGLLTDSAIQAAIDTAPPDKSLETGEDLARLLVRDKLLTAYQAQTIYKGKGGTLILGNYAILDQIGQGGMGLVLKAEHRRMKRIVALKVLSPDVTKSADMVARFEREVRAAARLNHPNIVTAFDADEAGRTHFFVMQYVDGVDLSSRIKKKGPLPVDKAVDCLRQAAIGLQYAHEQGIVHRDIKPANLLLESTGTVKILDMGLARMDESDDTHAELTTTGAVMGTVDYMPPEQALSTKHADARSDIYSLGITLWYLLIGRAAYDGDSMMARMLAHRDGEIPSLSATRSEVPKSLDNVFRKMVAKNPTDRYQTMTEVIAALDASLDGETSAPSVSRGPSEDDRLDGFLRDLAAQDSSIVSTPTDPLDAHENPVADPTVPLSSVPAGSPAVVVAANSSAAANAPLWDVRRWPRGRQAIAGGVLLVGIVLVAVFASGGSDAPPPNNPNVKNSTAPNEQKSKNENGPAKPEETVPHVSARKENPPDDPAPGRAKVPFPAAEATARQKQWADHLGVPVEYVNSVGMKFRLIPPGEYLRGLTKAQIGDLSKVAGIGQFDADELKLAEGPQHTTFITQPFYLGMHEVTQLQFKHVLGRNTSHFVDGATDNRPVEQVLWNEAVDFCNKLGQHERFPFLHERIGKRVSLSNGSGYRLPTEAEWEYACKSGSETHFSNGDALQDLSEIAWTRSNAEQRTHTVGTRKPNAFGLYDLHGNVREWCFNGWDLSQYGEYEKAYAVDPQGPEFFGFSRVVRGGSADSEPFICRSSARASISAEARDQWTGFRVVLTVSAVQESLKRKSQTPKPGDKPQPAVIPFIAESAVVHQRAWATYAGVKPEFINSVGMKFRLIPAGEFQMGSTDAEIALFRKETPNTTDLIQIADEGPRHKVVITKPFYLGTYEVTQSEYQKVTGGNPSTPPRDPSHPVGMVPWAKAVGFCNKLSVKEGRIPCYVNSENGYVLSPKGTGYRLPTEAEWEFACRAGTNSRWHFGNDAKLLDQYAWYNSNTYAAHPVGKKRPNAFGLYDMMGNHWEWCHDWYAAYPDAKPATDPVGPPTGKNKVNRGGFSMFLPGLLRSARRRWNDPGPTYPAAGFRVVLVIPPK